MFINHIEACKKFFQLEKELNLFEWNINGVAIWEMIRFQIFSLLMQNLQIYGQAHTQPESTLQSKIKKIFTSLTHCFFKNPYFASQKKFLFVGHSRRKLQSDNLYWDIYCDYLIDLLGNDCLLIEPYYLNAHLMPAKTANLYYFDVFFLLNLINRKINKKKKKLNYINIQILQDLENKIYEKFHVRFNLKDLILNTLEQYYFLYPLYQKNIRKLSPKIIFVVVSYGDGNEILIAAAKSLCIPVVELQHGVISKYHMGYSFSEGFKKVSFPDYFFSFGSFWKDIVDFPIAKKKIYNIGYPYLEKSLHQYANVKKTDMIIFISQGTIGKKLSKFAVQLKKFVPNHIRIVYKLHPGEYDRWRNEYPWLSESGIQVVDGQTPELYELFAQSKWQVGVYSTAIFEGLAFGCQTYLVDLPGVAYMDALINYGYAELINFPEEIIFQYESGQFNKNLFFADGWQANFLLAVQNILLQHTLREAPGEPTILSKTSPCN